MRRCLFLAVLCLVAAGCGSGSSGKTQTVTVTAGSGSGQPSDGGGSSGAPASTSSTPSKLRLLGAGYTEYVSSGDRQLEYYALIKNPNTTQTFDQAEIDFDFLSKSGTVIDSEQEYANFVLPDQAFPIAGEAFSPPATPIAKLRVRIGTPYNWIPAHPTSQLFAKMTQFHFSTSYGLAEAKGVASIRSTFTKEIKQAPVVFLYFGAHNRFVGFDQESANFIPAGGVAERSFDGFPHTTVIRVVPYAGLDNGSSIGNQALY